jgi:protein TonB
MSETGYFAQKRNSPTSLGLVILLHVALIAAVILVKGPAFQRILHPPIDVTLIEPIPDPPRNPPPPRPDQPQHPPERFDQPPPLTPTPPTGPAVDSRPPPNLFAGDPAGSGTVDIPRLPPPEPAALPVRRAAQIDSSSRLQPPYPPSELRLNRDGRVQVRVTIGPDGRVIDVALISATSDAFWLVTRQQALRAWRFHPATVDGRPVQETRTMSLVFRIEDQG